MKQFGEGSAMDFDDFKIGILDEVCDFSESSVVDYKIGRVEWDPASPHGVYSFYKAKKEV